MDINGIIIHGKDKEMNDIKNYFTVIQALGNSPDGRDLILSTLSSYLSMPNLETPTLGGHTFWYTIADHKGWKVQQNKITKHVRILDEHLQRVAWGSRHEMDIAMEHAADVINQL